MTLIVAGAALIGAPSALADQFYVGKLHRQEKSWVLIDRGPKVIEQAVYGIRSKCKRNGKPIKPSRSFHELKYARVSKNEFKIDRSIEGSSTGLKPPKYGVRSYLRGRFSRRSAEIEVRSSDFLRDRGGVERCRSGKQTGTLRKVSRARYERILEREFPFFDPRP